MKDFFDKGINRQNSNCIKWDALELFFDNNDILPLWVADLDFPAPHAVVEAVKKRAEHGAFGYPKLSNDFYDAVINWEKKKGYQIEKEWILYTPGIVPALNFAVQAYTYPGDQVLVQQPVYYPFMNAVKNNGREVVINKLIYDEEKLTYFINFSDLEEKLSHYKCKLFILSSPHNPVGRVWKKEELCKMADLCEKYQVILVSDEIHQDIIFKDNKHYPTASLNEKYHDFVITCTAASKTFNIAGLKSSSIIIPDIKLRERFQDVLFSNGLFGGDIFGQIASVAAYNHGQVWLDNLLIYLEKNYTFLKDFLKDKLPLVKVTELQGTYLCWLDFGKYDLTDDELKNKVIHQAKVGLNSGISFGSGGSGFMRINIGCPRKILEEALSRLEQEFAD